MWKSIYNPETGRFVKLQSSKGRKILKNYINMSGGADIHHVKCLDRHTRENGLACPDTKICNPRTGRCVNINGVTGRRSSTDWDELDRIHHAQEPPPAIEPPRARAHVQEPPPAIEPPRARAHVQEPLPAIEPPRARAHVQEPPPAIEPPRARAHVQEPLPAIEPPRAPGPREDIVVPDNIDDLRTFIQDHENLSIPVLEEALQKTNQISANARSQVPPNNQTIIAAMRLTMSITQKLTAARQRQEPPPRPPVDLQCTNPIDVISQENWNELSPEEHKDMIIIEIYTIPNHIMPYHPSIPFEEYISQVQFQRIENACITKDAIRHLLTDTPIHPDDTPIVQAHQNGRKDQEPYSGYNGLRLNKYGLDSCIWVNRKNDSGLDGNCNMNEQHTQQLVQRNILPPEIWLQKIPAITHSNMYLTLQATKSLYQATTQHDNDEPIRFRLYKSQYRLPVGNSADSTHEGATKGNVEFNIYTDTPNEWHYMERISDIILEHDIPTLKTTPILVGDYVETTFYEGDPDLYMGQVVDIDHENDDYLIVFTDPHLLQSIPGPHLYPDGAIRPTPIPDNYMWSITTDKRHKRNELLFNLSSRTPNINKNTLDISTLQPYTIQPIQTIPHTSWQGTSEWIQRIR